MPVVRLRPLASIDVAEIWDYIAEDSEAQADAFLDRLDAKFQILAGRPGLGRRRGELLADLQSFPFERYVIFYIPIVDGIEVVRVLHGARDIDAQFHQDA